MIEVQGRFISCNTEPDWRKVLEQCHLMGSQVVSGKPSGLCQEHLKRSLVATYYLHVVEVGLNIELHAKGYKTSKHTKN